MTAALEETHQRKPLQIELSSPGPDSFLATTHGSLSERRLGGWFGDRPPEPLSQELGHRDELVAARLELGDDPRERRHGLPAGTSTGA